MYTVHQKHQQASDVRVKSGACERVSSWMITITHR